MGKSFILLIFSSTLLVGCMERQLPSGTPSAPESSRSTQFPASPEPQGILEPSGKPSKVMLARACKRFVGDLMGRDPAIMQTDYEGDGVVGISYVRADDGKQWKYECEINGTDIIWRGVDISGPGEGPGRWRTEDAKPVSLYQ